MGINDVYNTPHSYTIAYEEEDGGEVLYELYTGSQLDEVERRFEIMVKNNWTCVVVRHTLLENRVYKEHRNHVLSNKG